MQIFATVGKMLTLGGWQSHIPGFHANSKNKESVRQFPRLCLTVPWFPDELKVGLASCDDLRNVATR